MPPSHSGDSYTDTSFNPSKPQPSPTQPFGNPPYNPVSPYLLWINYLTMNYNDSVIETYNFAKSGSTVNSSLIDNHSSSFERQVGIFMKTYAGGKKNSAGRGSRKWRSMEKRRTKKAEKENKEKDGKAQWEPQSTLFSIWFGINDNAFSSKSSVLFDQVFESFANSIHQVPTHPYSPSPQTPH